MATVNWASRKVVVRPTELEDAASVVTFHQGLQLVLLVTGAAMLAGSSVMNRLTPSTLILGLGSLLSALVLRLLVGQGAMRAAGYMVSHGLSAIVIAGRLAVVDPEAATRLSILFVLVIAATGLIRSARDAWGTALMAIAALWADSAVRMNWPGFDLDRTLTDVATMSLIYLSTGVFVHVGSHTVNQVMRQLEQGKRTLADRNALLERQVREREIAESRQAEMSKDMRELLAATHDLLACDSLEIMWEHVIHVAQQRLGIERCSIFTLSEDKSHAFGTYGVDLLGRVRDERKVKLDVAMQRWAPILQPGSETNRWLLEEDLIGDPKGGISRKQWTAVTAIRSYTGEIIGVMCNDTAISHRPFEASKQDMLAIFCSLIGSLVSHKQLERDLRVKESQAATVNERSRLARELHDSVSQALFGIVLGSRTAMEYNKSPEAGKPLEYVLSLAENALIEIRALIFELRPESLATDGLLPALRKQLDAFVARHNLAFEVSADSQEPQAPIEFKEALYRVSLEAVQNTIKHANASRVQVSVHQLPDRVRMEISDDGKGFNPRQEFAGHFGLTSMSERMARLGGTCNIDSEPGAGTRVTVVLPLTGSALVPA
jgi:signal transduction histidine kinase